MKKLALYTMMLLFVLQSTSYSYIVASFYINRDFIAENICINRFDAIPVCRGACYLTDQLKKESKKDHKLPNLKEKEVQLYLQEMTQLSVTGMPRNIYHRTIPPFREQLATSRFLYSIFHPPEMA
ncbi:hypothetical protein AAEO56_07125 [Flavobacterium sp. DGU11]|uniref:Uncharacterized protein n=1 Tax=Flavobacterium arundinis TaxID=3139143 RepID=A0ABU9HWY1_9FLAO